MDNSTASWLVESIGVTNTLGRIICGILTSFPGVNALLLNNVALTVGGIATIVSGLSFSPAYQFSYCGIFGLSIGKMMKKKKTNVIFAEIIITLNVLFQLFSLL